MPGLPEPGRTLVMGVVNATPDSFSDGGAYDPVAQSLALLVEGADLVDVGGESTRPGADRVGPEEELRRVLPVVRALVAEGAVVSVDTMRAATARACVEAGAVLVNDVSGGLADEAMLPAVAALGVPYVVMHWRGHSDVMGSRAVYGDVVAEVRDELLQRVAAAVDAGIEPSRLVLDPGLGFAKEAPHDWALVAALPELTRLGPLLVGGSRKRFLGRVLEGERRGPDRDDATTALTVLAAQAGAWAVRVHAVRASADAVRVVGAAKAATRVTA